MSTENRTIDVRHIDVVTANYTFPRPAWAVVGRRIHEDTIRRGDDVNPVYAASSGINRCQQYTQQSIIYLPVRIERQFWDACGGNIEIAEWYVGQEYNKAPSIIHYPDANPAVDEITMEFDFVFELEPWQGTTYAPYGNTPNLRGLFGWITYRQNSEDRHYITLRAMINGIWHYLSRPVILIDEGNFSGVAGFPDGGRYGYRDWSPYFRGTTIKLQDQTPRTQAFEDVPTNLTTDEERIAYTRSYPRFEAAGLMGGESTTVNPFVNPARELGAKGLYLSAKVNYHPEMTCTWTYTNAGVYSTCDLSISVWGTSSLAIRGTPQTVVGVFWYAPDAQACGGGIQGYPGNPSGLFLSYPCLDLSQPPQPPHVIGSPSILTRSVGQITYGPSTTEAVLLRPGIQAGHEVLRGFAQGFVEGIADDGRTHLTATNNASAFGSLVCLSTILGIGCQGCT